MTKEVKEKKRLDNFDKTRWLDQRLYDDNRKRKLSRKLKPIDELFSSDRVVDEYSDSGTLSQV